MVNAVGTNKQHIRCIAAKAIQKAKAFINQGAGIASVAGLLSLRHNQCLLQIWIDTSLAKKKSPSFSQPSP